MIFSEAEVYYWGDLSEAHGKLCDLGPNELNQLTDSIFGPANTKDLTEEDAAELNAKLLDFLNNHKTEDSNELGIQIVSSSPDGKTHLISVNYSSFYLIDIYGFVFAGDNIEGDYRYKNIQWDLDKQIVAFDSEYISREEVEKCECSFPSTIHKRLSYWAKRPLTTLRIPSEGISLELADREYSIGRSSKSDIVISDHDSDSSVISRRHAEISFYKEWRIKDLGSKNGTFVNGERIPVGQYILIEPSDKISLAGALEMYITVDETAHFEEVPVIPPTQCICESCGYKWHAPLSFDESAPTSGSRCPLCGGNGKHVINNLW